MSIRVTVTDTETGYTETTEIENDYVLVCAGDVYQSWVRRYPRTGTTIITIKTKKEGKR